MMIGITLFSAMGLSGQRRYRSLILRPLRRGLSPLHVHWLGHHSHDHLILRHRRPGTNPQAHCISRNPNSDRPRFDRRAPRPPQRTTLVVPGLMAWQRSIKRPGQFDDVGHCRFGLRISSGKTPLPHFSTHPSSSDKSLAEFATSLLVKWVGTENLLILWAALLNFDSSAGHCSPIKIFEI